MQIVVTTIKELSDKGVYILVHEDFNSQVAISNDGHCFIKGGVGVVEILSAPLTEKIFSLFDHYNLNTYMKDRTIEIDPLSPYTNNNTFMAKVYHVLLTNKYLTMSKLADAVGVDKLIGKKLMAFLIEYNMITSYHTYYTVTKDNELVISSAIEMTKRSEVE